MKKWYVPRPGTIAIAVFWSIMALCMVLFNDANAGMPIWQILIVYLFGLFVFAVPIQIVSVLIPYAAKRNEELKQKHYQKIMAYNHTCPRCGGHDVLFQTVSEKKTAGCGTYIFYILLAFTIFGLLIVIPLMLRKDDTVKSRVVCKNCGYSWEAK